ncbi:MAG: YhbY family RNA-binding protein [Verrucomicrobia bacterium]|nr:YhbY family RNA-binding protein [Verrucomicrobiota bacterium]
MTEKIPGPVLRKLKSRAQLLKPIVRVGRAGLGKTVTEALSQALEARELVKVKFEGFTDRAEKKRWIAAAAERTGSRLVQSVGNTAVYYRPRPEKADREEQSGS